MGYIKSQIYLIKRKDPAIKKNIEVFLYKIKKKVKILSINYFFNFLASSTCFKPKLMKYIITNQAITVKAI